MNEPPVITSYGLILFYIKDQDTPLFLLEQSRDSYEYIAFIRGQWSTEEQALEYLSLMSRDERRRIKKYPHDVLWNDLWITKSKRGYKYAQFKYETVKDNLPEMLANSVPQIDNEPPWGFPKGRKNGFETDLECALREFSEETKLPTDNIKLWPIKPLCEKYRGSDNRLYKTFYYLGEVDIILPIPKIIIPYAIRKETVSDEVSEINWATLSEANLKINPRRQCILKKVSLIIRNKYDEYGLFREEN